MLAGFWELYKYGFTTFGFKGEGVWALGFKESGFSGEPVATYTGFRLSWRLVCCRLPGLGTQEMEDEAEARPFLTRCLPAAYAACCYIALLSHSLDTPEHVLSRS